MSHITTTSAKGIALIKFHETLKLKPYLCPAGVPTIGWGTTRYPNGSRVRLSDPSITAEQADEYLKHDLADFERKVDQLTRDDLTQSQFDALVSFTYNVGEGNLRISTLLKKVNKDPNDRSIRNEFGKWVRANDKVLNGLIARRAKEADLYFS